MQYSIVSASSANCLQMSPLSAGWAKVQEIRRHLAFFRESGKYTMVYMAQVWRRCSRRPQTA